MSDTDFARVANDFQPDAGALEDQAVPFSAHVALYIVLALLLVAITWSVIGKLDRIVVAPGKIASQTPTLVMQPYTTSRVTQILVKPGDHVTKGQLLAKFDPAFAEADVSTLRQKVASLTAQMQRLQAQLAGGSYMAKPGDGMERLTQAQIFAQEMNDLQAEMNQRDSRLAELGSQIAVDQDAVPGIQNQLAMANKVVQIQQYLQSQQAAATLDVMRAQSSAIDSSLKLKNTLGDARKLAQQRVETAQERDAYLAKWRSDHNQQLVQARQDLSEAAQTLNKAARIDQLTDMTAPVNATVLDIAGRSVGSVLREAETLVTLVPDDAELYVEASVAARDISYLKLGDTVRVKLDSYPFQRYGTITGTLTVISADSSPLKEGDQDPGKLVYRVRVQLNDNAQTLAARGIHLKPGLAASAEIKTGDRSIATYILDPVLKLSNESMREP